jgi:hypothetical protein
MLVSASGSWRCKQLTLADLFEEQDARLLQLKPAAKRKADGTNTSSFVIKS